MASNAYWAWDRAGRKWQPARPVAAFADNLRCHGYTVGVIGSDDVSHLQAATPEDHCPFSATGWPIPSPRGFVFAADVMPPPPGSDLPSLQQLGAQLVADRQAGIVTSIKYINWEPDRNWAGRCVQDSWTPDHVQVPTEDRGHIHVSWRSDCLDATDFDNYDLVARVRGATNTEVRSMAGFLKWAGANEVFYTADGATSRHVGEKEILDIRVLSGEGIYPPLGFRGEVRTVGERKGQPADSAARKLIPPIVATPDTPVPPGWQDRALQR